MFNKQRVQSLINLNLTKFFRFREHITTLDEVFELADLIFESMAKEIAKQHKLTLAEYLDEVREAIREHSPESKKLMHEFWVAQAQAGWLKAFPEDMNHAAS